MHSSRSSAGHRQGSIEVICGSMFSGKTEELQRLIKRTMLARRPIQVFKPRIDDRYSKDQVASHNKTFSPAIVIDHAADIYEHLAKETEVVAIDEGQFFDDEIVDVCNELADRGLRVIVAGLDMNYLGEPFHPMPEIMAIAETVHKLRAVCVVCGEAASRTQRLVEERAQVLVGDSMSYEARCRACFDAPDLAPAMRFTLRTDAVAVSEESSPGPLRT
jgi:thymidine kinase